MKPGPAAEPVPKGKGSASARRSTKVVVDAPATPTTRPTTLVPLLASDQPGRQSTLQVRRAQDLDPQYRRISALAGGLSPRQGASVSVAASQAGAVTRSPDRLAPISALEAGAAFVSAPAGARPLPPGFVYDKCGCVKRDPASWRMFPPRKHWPCREPQAEAQAQLRGPCRSVSVRRRVPSP